MPFEEKASLNTLMQEIESEMTALVQKVYPEAGLTYQLLSITKDLLSGKKVSNVRFDKIYPSMIRKLSSVHWTPVDVAIKAASLLVMKKGTKVLDIGSGCGKFCLIGASIHQESHFSGIEQRSYLNEISKIASNNFKLKNTTFLDGNVIALDWSEYDAFYLFNPFYENKMLPFNRIDITVPANQYRYEFYIETVQSKLAQLKQGTRVVTYHGFGGDFPEGYELHYQENIGTSELELWIKR